MAAKLTRAICGGVVGEVHKCILCKKCVHVFLWEANKDEEEFGQTDSSFICLKKKSLMIFIIRSFYYRLFRYEIYLFHFLMFVSKLKWGRFFYN